MHKSLIHIPLGYGGEIVEATFLARPNRFLVEAQLGHEVVRAHLADRGRLRETLVGGARILLAHRPGPGRATQYQAVGSYVGERLASIDTGLPNRLVEAALRARAIVPYAAYPQVQREATVGHSRFDFLLSDGQARFLVEVKSAGLIIDGAALFPDAPTDRGRRHVLELAALAASGERTSVVFIAQGVASRVSMHRAIDPAFAEALEQARAAGVEVRGYSCPVTPQGITFGDEIEVV